MKKVLVKALMVVGIAAFGMVIGHSLWLSSVHAIGFADNSTSTAGADFGLGNGGGKTAVDLIKGFINWILGLLSIIALGVSLWGGFQMVTAAGDDTKYKGGFKILKQAAVGLIIIGLSWIIVSTIFSFIGGVGTGDVWKGV